MDRLTIDEIIGHCSRKARMYEKTCDIKYLETSAMSNSIKEYWEHKQVAGYLKKLKDYEDSEEHGLLLRLPISEDAPVYSIEYCCGKNKSNRSGMCFRGFCENCSDKAYYIRESVAKVISMREYVDEVEKAFKRVSELKL